MWLFLLTKQKKKKIAWDCKKCCCTFLKAALCYRLDNYPNFWLIFVRRCKVLWRRKEVIGSLTKVLIISSAPLNFCSVCKKNWFCDQSSIFCHKSFSIRKHNVTFTINRSIFQFPPKVCVYNWDMGHGTWDMGYRHVLRILRQTTINDSV